MAIIEVEAKVHLPHDANGVSAQPGQIITVDTDNPFVRGYLETGLLYPLTPLKFELELQPPVPPAQDGADDAAAGEQDGVTVGPLPDAPQHAAQAPDTGAPARGLLPPYDANTVAQLEAELDARGVTYSGTVKKADLVELLEADDAQRG